MTATPGQDLAQLHVDLQTALAVEHATVPPYLAAWATLAGASGGNADARRILHTVLVEEMLHMVQVANLLLAVGGTPRLAFAGFVPKYPHALPGAAPGFAVPIQPFSAAAIADFKRIEQPRPVGGASEERDWHTIGQFYEGVLGRYRQVVGERPELLAANQGRQIDPAVFYGTGRLLRIGTLADAEAAVHEIMTEGEGADGGVFDDDRAIYEAEGREPAHYFRFDEIDRGKRYEAGDTVETGPRGREFHVDYGAAHPMRPNATIADYSGEPAIAERLIEFNRLYGRLLQSLEQACTGSAGSFTVATAQMFAVGRAAEAITRTPDPTTPGRTVGLVFDPIFSI